MSMNGSSFVKCSVKWMESDSLATLMVTSDTDLRHVLADYCGWLYDCSSGEIDPDLAHFWLEEANSRREWEEWEY